MKRSKSANVQVEYVQKRVYSVTCPHCHATMRGGISDDVVRMSCWNCDNPIDLIFTVDKKSE